MGETGMAGWQPAQAAGNQNSSCNMDCARSMVGRIIGKNGETVKALQSFSGAQIQIDQSTDPTRVSISGPPYSLSLAVSMVQDIISGSFKGFALLRQTSRPATADGPMQVPSRSGQGLQYPSNQQLQFQPQQQQSEPRPVYAPGYGLIPASQLYEERSSVPNYGPRGLIMEAQMNLLQAGYPMQGGRQSSQGYMSGTPNFGPMGLMNMGSSQGGLYSDDGGGGGLGHGYNDMLGGNSYASMGLDPSNSMSYLMTHGLGHGGSNGNSNGNSNNAMMHPAMAAALGSNSGGGGGRGNDYNSGGSRDNNLDYGSLSSQQRLMQMSSGNGGGLGGGLGGSARALGGGRGQGGYSGRRGGFLNQIQ